MPIDIRAEVSCSLGTVISGSFADDYLQGNGLIKTRGEVVLDGTQTPEVGTEVTFTYAKAGSTYTVPRVLRVLSSFADPFRRTTTVQLGCKLTYLENRKPPVQNPSSKDENSTVPCKVFLKATLPITAEYVFQQCLDALQLDAASIPLTNKFSVEEFDLTPGYIQVMSDLLQSEGYAGYLDSEETLQFLDLTEEASTGPVITPADVVDLGPIGSGELPGESVVVRWSNLRLLPPDELYGDDYLKRSWEIEEVFGAPSEVTVSYTDDNGNTQSDSDVFYPFSFAATRYDVWDRKIESISLNLVSSAETNNRWASDAFRQGRLWNLPTARLTREVVEYEKAAAAANNANLMSVQQIGGGVNDIKAQLGSAAEAHTGLANLCKEEVPEGADVVKSQTTFNYFSELELAGSLNIDTYISDSGSLVEFDTIAAELDSFVVVEYETDTNSGLSKTITKRSVSRSQTVSGQQDLATRAQELDTADLSNSISSLLGLARRQVYVGAETSLHTQREYGLQKRPSEAERNNTANSKPQISESKAEITWIVGSTTSTAVIEFTLPYAPDDAISWNETTGEFSSTPSDAEQKAMRYGRVQNALLLGNRNGVSLQLAPEQLPKRPFDPLYLQAGGITGSYRVNATSWAFDANGIVASTDALLWGAVSAASGTNLSSSWVPLAPGTTSLPLPYTPSPGGTDSETGVTYSAVITPTVVLAPYVESVKVEGISRSTMALTDYPYTLDRGTETQVAVTKSKVVVGSKLTADATSYVLAGQAANGTYTRKLIGAAGGFVSTGYSAGSVRSYGIGTNAGTFVLSGQPALLEYDKTRKLSADKADFSLNGQIASLDYTVPVVKLFADGHYSGSSSSQSITGLGFKPGMLWFRRTSTANDWVIADMLRPVNELALPNAPSNPPNTNSQNVQSLDSDGFTIGNSAYVSGAGTNFKYYAWKEGGAPATNTNGTISVTESLNAALGLSYVQYTGTGGSVTVGHSLGVAPDACLLYRSGTALYIGGPLIGVNKFFTGVSTSAAASSTSSFQAFSSTTVSMGDFNNTSGTLYTGYFFAAKNNYSAIGTYVGTGTTKTVSFGFAPRLVVIKALSGTSEPIRAFFVPAAPAASPRYHTLSSGTTADAYSSAITFTSTGIDFSGTTISNTSGRSYWYMAFA